MTIAPNCGVTLLGQPLQWGERKKKPQQQNFKLLLTDVTLILLKSGSHYVKLSPQHSFKCGFSEEQ